MVISIHRLFRSAFDERCDELKRSVLMKIAKKDKISQGKNFRQMDFTGGVSALEGALPSHERATNRPRQSSSPG